MKIIVSKSDNLYGKVIAPSSKSHTHRAIILASLASGISTIKNPLLSDDCLATIDACRALGAEIKYRKNVKITGFNGKPNTPKSIIDVKNSGTTIRFMTAVSTLCKGDVKLTGDSSIKKRPIGELIRSLNDLGAYTKSVNNNDCPPVEIKNNIKGGITVLNGISSQFLSALLITCPFADNNSEIKVTNLKSKPYINLTLDHLRRAGITIQNDNLKNYKITGKQRIDAKDYTVPGDYSSAAFLLAAASITNSKIKLKGLDPNDAQGDKLILNLIKEMKICDKREIDLMNNPDLLPIIAVMGCFSEGKTILRNVEHARLKESDRINSIFIELKKMGAEIQELKDGLIINRSNLKGAKLNGHNDHRIVMALAIAALGSKGTSVINNAETISVSFPNFIKTMQKLNANIKVEE